MQSHVTEVLTHVRAFSHVTVLVLCNDSLSDENNDDGGLVLYSPHAYYVVENTVGHG